MDGGLRSSNARPGGAYQAPVLPTSVRVGGDVIKPETWDEVLTYLQKVLEENSKLNQVLQENNDKVEQVIRKKDEEIETAHKLYWDVRISVLGFKAKIMSLTGEVEQLKDGLHSASSGNTTEEVNELKRQIEDLKSKKQTADVSAHQLNDELSSLRSKVSHFEDAYRQAHQENTNNKSIRVTLEHKVHELEELLKKSRSPPQPKPRTNIQQPRQDGKIAQLERERDDYRLQAEKHQQRADQEHGSRQQAEERWMSVRAELDASLKALQDSKFENSQLVGELRNLKVKVDQLNNEIIEVRRRPSPGGRGEPSMATGVGGSNLRARKLLNDAIQERNEFEKKYIDVTEEIKELQHKLSEQKRRYDEASIENSRLKEANWGKDQELGQLREQLDDNKYHLEQKNSTLETRVRQVDDQLQNLNEKYHALQVEYSKALSSQRALKQQADSENKELEQEWKGTVKEMEELMGQLEEKESVIRKLQNDLQQVLSQKENAESDLNHSQQKLRQKQNDCDNYLSQMEAWRAQYETAQSDFAQERAVREKEAKAVQTLRENRDELQREIGELRKRVTDQRITIANLQTSSGYVPESYTREINVPSQAGGLSPNSRRTQRYHVDDLTGVGGAYNAPLLPQVPETGPMYKQDPPPMRFTDSKFPVSPKPEFGDPKRQEMVYNVPDPNLGKVGGSQGMNQLDDPPPAGISAYNKFTSGPPYYPPSGGDPPFNHPPPGGSTHRSQANAFPQFPQGHDRGPDRGGGGLGDAFDLPGEVQKMEAPIVDNCPICGRTGFKTQTDLEVHAAKCG